MYGEVMARVATLLIAILLLNTSWQYMALYSTQRRIGTSDTDDTERFYLYYRHYFVLIGILLLAVSVYLFFANKSIDAALIVALFCALLALGCIANYIAVLI